MHAKFAGMEVSAAKRLREPERENRNLKRLLADWEPELDAIRGFFAKKAQNPPLVHAAMVHLVAQGISRRRSYQVVGIARSVLSYSTRLKTENQLLVVPLKELATRYPCYGYRTRYHLLRRAGLAGQS